MEKLCVFGVCALKFHCSFCSSQSCNVLSTLDNGTSHPGLGLGPDNECKKIWQPYGIRKKFKMHEQPCGALTKKPYLT